MALHNKTKCNNNLDEFNSEYAIAPVQYATNAIVDIAIRGLEV